MKIAPVFIFYAYVTRFYFTRDTWHCREMCQQKVNNINVLRLTIACARMLLCVRQTRRVKLLRAVGSQWVRMQ
jgi:hypothetical protein